MICSMIEATSNDGESVLHVVPGGYAELEVIEARRER